MSDGPVLLTGASGFVGTRLGHALVESGREVRAMTRHPESYDGPGQRSSATSATPVLGRRTRGLHRGLLPRALPGLPRLRPQGRRGGPAFGRAAADAGVRQIVYLGGLGATRTTCRAPAQPPRGGGAARRGRRAGHRAARWHRHRAGGLSWEMTRQRSTTCRDGHPALGRHPHPADRRRRRDPLPGRRAGQPGASGEIYEVGGPEVLRYATAAAGRGGAAPPAAAGAGAAADPGPLVALAVAGDRRGRAGGQVPGGLDGERGRRLRRRDPSTWCRSSRWASTPPYDAPSTRAGPAPSPRSRAAGTACSSTR